MNAVKTLTEYRIYYRDAYGNTEEIDSAGSPKVADFLVTEYQAAFNTLDVWFERT